MIVMSRCIRCAFLILFFVSVVPAQNAGKKAPQNPASFVLDQHKPFVYVEFLRVGKREPLGEGEVSEGVWLRIVNNCRVPIQFMVSGENGDEAIPNEEVVYDEYNGVVATTPDGRRSPPAQTPRSQMPGGYIFEVGSNYTLAPGKGLTFSVPINHVAEDWHIEIPFAFVLPTSNSRCCQPRMSAMFFLYDVPEEYKSKFQKHKKDE